MELREIVETIPDFDGWNHAEKIRFFAWFLNSPKGRDRFMPKDVAACYDQLHLAPPASIGPFLSSMMDRKPKELVKNTSGYQVVKHVRDDYDKKFGQRQATVQVHKLLSDLPGKISDEAEKRFLTETIICFKHKAFRASIVMSWSLAYAHLEDWIIAKHLPAFNVQVPVRYPSMRSLTVANHDDFGRLKESEVLEICKSAGLISGNLKKIMDEKLGKRNTAAHPSTVEVTSLTAEEYITDLVNNIVLKLK